eukprot:389806-Amphidinium_carterae.1
MVEMITRLLGRLACCGFELRSPSSSSFGLHVRVSWSIQTSDLEKEEEQERHVLDSEAISWGERAASRIKEEGRVVAETCQERGNTSLRNPAPAICQGSLIFVR